MARAAARTCGVVPWALSACSPATAWSRSASAAEYAFICSRACAGSSIAASAAVVFSSALWRSHATYDACWAWESFRVDATATTLCCWEIIPTVPIPVQISPSTPPVTDSASNRWVIVRRASQLESLMPRVIGRDDANLRRPGDYTPGSAASWLVSEALSD